MGILDHTLIIVTSDHGEEFFEHGSIRHTTSVYDELIKIPLIMKVPGMKGGIEIGAKLNQVDIMPTLLELMKMKIPSNAQGHSFVSMITDQEKRKAHDRVIYAEVNLTGRTNRSCIIQDDWKYVEGDTDPELHYPAPVAAELFNLTEDTYEQKDLLLRHQEKSESLKEKMHLLQKNLLKMGESNQADQDDTVHISNKLRELLKQQGYL